MDVITGGVWWAGHVIDAPQVEENVKKKKKRKKSGDSGFVSQWTMNIYNTIFEKKVGRQIKALHEPKNWYFNLVPRERNLNIIYQIAFSHIWIRNLIMLPWVEDIDISTTYWEK